MSHLMKGKVYGLTVPQAKTAGGQAPPARVVPLKNSLMNKKPSIFNQPDSESDQSGKILDSLITVYLSVRYRYLLAITYYT